MVKIIANIKLYINGRNTPFESGYRPMFNLINEMNTSGRIDLINKDKFYPGEEGEVNITFINLKYLGDGFNVGKKFVFGEGGKPLGEGTIKVIL